MCRGGFSFLCGWILLAAGGCARRREIPAQHAHILWKKAQLNRAEGSREELPCGVQRQSLWCPLENLQIPLAKRGKCGYNEWECARMGTAQDKPWKASRGGCEPGQDCLMANHPGARFSEATRAERAERVGKDGFSRYRESRCVRLHRADRHRACQVGWYRG